MGMSIDFKVTTWERLIINDEKDFEKLLEGFKTGKLTCNDDVYDVAENVDFEQMEDTTEKMTVADNNGNATIEIMVDGENIWDNTKEV